MKIAMTLVFVQAFRMCILDADVFVFWIRQRLHARRVRRELAEQGIDLTKIYDKKILEAALTTFTSGKIPEFTLECSDWKE